MAIAAIPTNFYVTQGNGQILTQWSIVAGATSYNVQRSIDGVTYASVATPAVATFLDTTVLLGVTYYYKVASVNGSGTSGYTSPQSIVAATSGEMSLSEIRLHSQQKADRLNSNFVTVPEWNSFINRAMFELYDLLVDQDADLFVAVPASFTTTGSIYRYPLPNGALTFQDDSGANFIPEPFYRLTGVDLALQTANNAFVTIHKFTFMDRNQFVYPNSASTIYGVFNMRYRLVGKSTIEFIPTPSASQKIRLWYVPRLKMLLQDNDLSDISISGWIEYVICRAAKYALDKEESDTTKLDAEILYLKERIEASAINRDVGQPDRITDIRGMGSDGNGGGGWSGSTGGF